MAQITGVSMRWSVTVGISSVLRCETPPLASAPPMPPPAAVSLRSSPEQKPRPSPVKTIARTSISRSYSVSFRPSAVSISTLIAFIRSGRLSLSTATCPSFSAIKSLIEISSTHRAYHIHFRPDKWFSLPLTVFGGTVPSRLSPQMRRGGGEPARLGHPGRGQTDARIASVTSSRRLTQKCRTTPGLRLRVSRLVLLVQLFLRRRSLLRAVIGADSYRILGLSVDRPGFLAGFVAEFRDAPDHRVRLALLTYRSHLDVVA